MTQTTVAQLTAAQILRNMHKAQADLLYEAMEGWDDPVLLLKRTNRAFELGFAYVDKQGIVWLTAKGQHWVAHHD